MPLEIERKFLVRSEDFKQQAFKANRIIQGYIPTLTGVTVRIRIKGEKAFITLKDKSYNGGLSRYEWEKEIETEEARELLKLCGNQYIDKTRFEIKAGKHVFEVDEFYGENEGLIIAEVELDSEEENYEKPDWLGIEVTGDKKYYNSRLLANPYKNWK